MAAPNRSTITARVERIDEVEGAPKWYMTAEVLDIRAIEGGLFVNVGDTARIFVVGQKPTVRPGDEIRAEVEYIGGSDGGELQLLQLDDIRPPGHNQPIRPDES